MAYCFRLLPTLSDIPPIRANAVIVVVVIVVVDIAIRRNAKKDTTRNLYSYLFSFVLQAIDIYFTSDTILLQYSADPPLNISKFIDNSIKNNNSSQ